MVYVVFIVLLYVDTKECESEYITIYELILLEGRLNSAIIYKSINFLYSKQCDYHK